MGSARSLIAELGVLQPPIKILGGEPQSRQQFAHHPIHLGTRDLGHLFPPTPAAASARRHWPGNSLSDGDATPPSPAPASGGRAAPRSAPVCRGSPTSRGLGGRPKPR